jgi:hypothetical protein
MSQYADPSDLPKYLPQTALDTTTSAAQLQSCIDASEIADSYLRGRYTLPLLAWGADVRMYTAWVACYLLMAGRGFNAAAGSDRLIVERYYMALGNPSAPGTGWFPGIQRQAIHPDVTPSLATGQDPVHDQPQVSTQPVRGWQQFNRRGRPVVGGF